MEGFINGGVLNGKSGKLFFILLSNGNYIIGFNFNEYKYPAKQQRDVASNPPFEKLFCLEGFINGGVLNGKSGKLFFILLSNGRYIIGFNFYELEWQKRKTVLCSAKLR